MLARSFMPATDLGITEPEVDALVQVLGMLEREEIPESKFTMTLVGEPECGTPGCILGWTRVVSVDVCRILACRMSANRALFWLFCPSPHTGDRSPYVAERSEAASALRSYLTTGKANWAAALA